MINREILKTLLPVTDEEQAILDGRRDVDRSLYSDENNGVVNSRKLLSEGKLIAIRPHTRFVHFPAHTHDYVEVVYMCQGSTVHTVNGNRIVLNEGELLFMSQGAVQEIEAAGGNDIAVNFIILPQFFDKSLAMLGNEDTPLKDFLIACLSENTEGGFLHFRVSEVYPVQNLVENLLYTLIADMPNKRQINQMTMGLLILELLNHTDKLADGDNSPIIHVMRYIEEHYQNGSLTELADAMHYDFAWLSREIKRRTGKTYTELLQEKRLSQAAYYLTNTDMKVDAVSLAVGYENISYFHRLFAGRYGTSPKKYRSANKDTFSVI